MKERLLLLDAGRGLAALIVLVHHLMVFEGDALARVLAGSAGLLLKVLNVVSSFNFHAVMFFFFISGWSIFLSVRRLTNTDGEVAWSRYLWHRARRILPMFWIALAWSFWLTMRSVHPEVDRSATALIGNLFFLQTSPAAQGAWFAPFAGDGPLWSLSYEVWYYLMLPVVIAIMSYVPARIRSVSMGVFTSISIGVAAIGLNRIAPNPFLLFATLSPVWVAGYVFALSLSQNRQARTSATILGALLLISGLAFFIRSDTLVAMQNGYAVASTVVALVGLGRLRVIAATLKQPAARAGVGVLAYVGLGSYSIYILHYPLLIFLTERQTTLPWVCAAILALVVIAPGLESCLHRRLVRGWVRNTPAAV